MRRPLLLVVSLFLTASLAWAGDVAPNDPLFADEGGGCMLPDLAGLSPEQAAAAALQAGFQASPNEVQVPACPVKFDCTSIGNCAAGPICSLTDIGACCQTPSGPVLCCLSGTIKVRRCPCQCTGPACSLLCASSTDVRWRCA
jgi:hypothetical protein